MSYKSTEIQIPSTLGKIPPQATDLEEIILGAILLQSTQIPLTVYHTLQPEFFYKDSHQKIYFAISELRHEGTAVDISTVTARLRHLGNLEAVGGPFGIVEITTRVASSANIEFHLLIIHQMFLKRELIRIGMDCMQNMYDDTTDPFEEIRSIISKIKSLEKGIFKRSESDSNDLMDELLSDMLEVKKDGLLGYPTGLKGLDHICRGDQKGSLKVIAAATSVGKTILLCTEALNCCFDSMKQLLENQTPTAIFSLEMPKKQLSYRLISNLSSIPNTSIKTNKMTNQESQRLVFFMNEFRKAQLYIDDTPGLTINECEAKCTMLVAMGVRKVYIDYYQLMKGDPLKKYGTREQELADISRRLKILAKELDIAIILLAQIGEEVLKRKLHIPTLSDLRECKALAHDADTVVFIWRPEYYENVLDDLNNVIKRIYCILFNVNIEEFERMCFLIVAKNRDGELGKIPFKFDGKIMRICDNVLILDAIDRINNGIDFDTLDTNQVEVPF